MQTFLCNDGDHLGFVSRPLVTLAYFQFRVQLVRTRPRPRYPVRVGILPFMIQTFFYAKVTLHSVFKTIVLYSGCD